MKRIKFHNSITPIVVVKTGGVSAAITAAATVGIFAVATITAVAIADALDEVHTKVDKFIGIPETPEKEQSKELVKDTFRTKTRRVVAKTFLKNLFK